MRNENSERDFDGIFTRDRPINFNFHGYPWLIHRLTYKHTNHASLHVHGYRERGNINTPLELADRAAHLKEEMRNAIIDNTRYAHEHGSDRPEITDWTWPD